MPSTKARLLVAGGCHVHGYPVGEHHSFGFLAAQATHMDFTWVAKVNLGNPSTLLQSLQQNGPPDILVLQLGHYEAPSPIPKHMRLLFPRLLKKWKAGSSSSSSRVPFVAPAPDAFFIPKRSWRLRILGKQLYAAAAQYTQPPIFNANLIASRLHTLLATLQRAVPRIVVITPLPCADPMARHFRLLAAPLFEQVCLRAAVPCLDAGSALGYDGPGSQRPFTIFADERHLNATGHQMLARALVLLLSPTPSP